jgi:disulfide bond formation protein DsbB
MSFGSLNFFLALATLLLQIAILVLLALFFARKKFSQFEQVTSFLVAYAIPAGFFLSLVTAGMTLYYSEVLGFVPCGLCWLQRIFLYPQAIILGIAWWKKDRNAADYSIALSIIGSVVALYQHYLQMGGTEVLPCPAVAETGSCAQRIIFEFGYITFPLMSFTVFAVLIVLMLYVRAHKRTIPRMGGLSIAH